MSLLLLTAAALAGTPRGVETGVTAPEGYHQAAAPRRVALVVGVNTYDDAALGDLTFAAKDARDVGAALADPGVGGFEVLLLDGEVQGDALLAAFDQITATLQRDDTFLFYFAGHGTLDIEDNRSALYLLPSDATLLQSTDSVEELEARKERWLSIDALERRVEALPAHSRVVIIDACHNGTGRSQLSPYTTQTQSTLRGAAPPPEDTLSPQRSDAWLFAAYFNQPAREDEALENGVFTHFLVEALRERGDMDGDGLVNVDELHTYVAHQTVAFTGNAQTPWIRTTEVGRSEIYLAGDPTVRGRAERAILYDPGSLPQGTQTRVDGAARGVGGVAPGWHRVEVTRGDEVLVRTPLHLSAGERVDLAALVADRERAWLLGVGGAAVWPMGEVPTVQPWAATLQTSLWPADAQGGRPGLTLSASAALGPVGERADLPTGDALAGVRFVWGQRWWLGPSAAAGVLWRKPEGQGGRTSFVVAPGLALSRMGERGFLSLEGSWRVLPQAWLGEDTPRMMPTLTATAGVRL
ncbi:MAG: caspase family protein [Alphaproteobacteria bacterium]|nr:caspase family protein [Alphaproteobacteria bacterium]